MKLSLTIAISPVLAVLDRMRTHLAEANTTDVIRELTGHYFADVGSSVQLSSNAQFGRFLSRNAKALGIRLVNVHERIVDDHGRKSTSARWAL